LLTILGNVTSFNDPNVLNGVTYWYQVTALGESVRSNQLSAMPVGQPPPPTLDLASGNDGFVTIAWGDPPADGGAPITGCKVYRGTSPGNETLLVPPLGVVNTYTDQAVSNGTIYYDKVSAVNSFGESAKSNERAVMPATPATAPGAPTLAVPTAGNGTVSLSWSTPGSDGRATITGYRIYRGTSSGNETLLQTVDAVNAFVDTFASNGTTYYYEVAATNSIGESAKSNERTATPSVPASVPGEPPLRFRAPTALRAGGTATATPTGGTRGPRSSAGAGRAPIGSGRRTSASRCAARGPAPTLRRPSRGTARARPCRSGTRRSTPSASWRRSTA
jgi:fibronectin type 3 domain-containing protein